MMIDADRLLALLRALNQTEVDYAVFGAVALGLHGLVRATEDVDLFVRPDADNVERLKTALRAVWADPSIDGISAADLLGEYPALRYGPPGESFGVDIVSRLGTAFAFEDLEVEILEVEGEPVPVASPLTLYRMKRDTVRPKDRIDAEALRRTFKLEDD